MCSDSQAGFWLALVVRSAFLAAAVTVLAMPERANARDGIGHGSCCGRQDVILIRGGAGYWPGIGELAARLERSGFAPTIVQCWEHRAVADEIAAAVRQGRMPGGVVIVGYSSGADAACHMARRLKSHGVRVDTLVLIESTLGTEVPSNVRYCINYYESRALDVIPVFRGVPVARAGRGTQIVNVNVGRHPGLESLAALNHFTVPNSPQLHSMVVSIAQSRHAARVMYVPHGDIAVTEIGVAPPSQASLRQ